MKDFKVCILSILSSLPSWHGVNPYNSLTTGDLSPYKQSIATRFCTPCVFIWYNNTGVKCNKKQVLKPILKHDLD